MPEQKMISCVVGGLALGALLVYYRRQSCTSQKTELELIYFDIEGIFSKHRNEDATKSKFFSS